MKLLLLPAVLAVGLTLAAHAQTSRFIWQRSIGTRFGGESAAQMIKCRTGGYLICGTTPDSVTRLTSTYVVKLNEQGQTVWERRIDPGQNHAYRGVSLAENRSGQVLVTTQAGDFMNDVDTRLDLLSPTGQSIWDRFYDSPLTDYIGPVKLGNDGNFVGIATLLGDQSVFKLDSTGRFLWQQVVPYDSTLLGGLMDVVPVAGGYVVTNSFYSNVPPYGLRGYLVKLTEGGSELTRRPVPRNFLNYRSAVDNNGNILFAHGQLSRVSAQLDTLWTKDCRSGAKAVTCLQDGNVLTLGYIYSGGYPDIALAKVAPNGQVIVDTVFWRSGTYEEPVDLAQDAQGNFVVCANTSSGILGSPAIILLKLRPWTQTLSLPDDSRADAGAVTLYPNPAHEAFYLHGAAPLSGALTLRDALGRVLGRQALSATTRASCSLAAQPPGVYLLTFSEPARTRTWRVLKQ